MDATLKHGLEWGVVCLVASLVVQDWLSSEYNGLYVDNLGDAFVIDAPYSVWGTFDGRHYCAYNVRQVSKTEFSGEFQDSSSMVVGWTQSPDANGQEAAQRSLMQDYPYDSGQAPPQEIPYIPPPQGAADSGKVKLELGATHSTLNLSWTTSDGKVVYSDAIYFVGKASAISMNGTYKAGNLIFSISEVGDTARRPFDGLVTIQGKSYALHGNCAWTRAGFTLSTPANPAIVGRGWIEWQPTPRFTQMLRKGRMGPSDQIEIYFDLTSGEFPDGVHKILPRS